jgi:predicted DsbA family dithiol-disulfide isomerase
MRAILLAAALSTLLQAGCAGQAAPPAAVPPAPPAGVEPNSPEGLLPGIPLDGLTEPQQRLVADLMQEEFCYCGCPHTVSQCLRQHQGCHHAKRQARLAARLASTGLSRTDLQKALTDYYSGFDRPRRAHLDLAGFGPPLGNEKAPVTIVEFSDFTCPYCQLLRPILEKFVEERRDRVRLFYKPFPIESHPYAVEAAQAGEWARDQGIFWPMHDQLFTHPHAVTPPDLVDYARALGKDGGDLREALESSRYRYKVEGSQAEARLAGLRGTPTLFFGGRRHAIMDYSEWMLEFMVQDEEEWQESQGWSKDGGSPP